MRIALITFDFMNIGVRMLSSFIKAKGVEVNIFFLPPEKIYDPSYTFPEQAKEQLAGELQGIDLVGISLLTHYYPLAADLTRHLRKAGKNFIIWGGIHPTIDPAGCLKHADGVAIGESEESLGELIDNLTMGKDYLSTDGFWFNSKGEIIRNALRPPPANLDSLPIPEISFEGHFILSEGIIRPMDRSIYKQQFIGNSDPGSRLGCRPNYVAVFSRGCPNYCTFCCNNRLNRLFGPKRGKVRMRSIDNIFKELKLVKEMIPEIGFISIDDDNFLAQPVDRLEEFASRWSKKIDLPFKVSGSLHFITHNRIRPLVESGLRQIQMGIQSGSDTINRNIYRRKIESGKVLETAYILNTYKDRLLPVYDFIFDNPYESSRDRLETAKLIQKLPKPYAFQSFSLKFFPGTELYDRALKDRLIKDEIPQLYEKRTNEFNTGKVSYLKLLCLLLPSIPDKAGKVLTWTPWARFWDMPIWTPLFTIAAKLLLWLKKRLKISRINTSSVYRRGEGRVNPH